MEWKVEDGDFVIENGDVFIVELELLIAQLLASIFGTRTGKLQYDPKFGFDSEFITSSITVQLPDDVLLQLEDIVRSMVSNYMSTINNVDVVLELVNNNTVNISLKSVSNNKTLVSTTINLLLERS